MKRGVFLADSGTETSLMLSADEGDAQEGYRWEDEQEEQQEQEEQESEG